MCQQAIARGWEVTSISSSGRPFRTRRGHAPAWTTSPNMTWAKADAMDPASYRDLAASTAVVHTMGILLEAPYKGADGSLGGVLQGLAKGWGWAGSGANPLAESDMPTYERINRDAALTVARTVKEAARDAAEPVPFVYLSAEDIMRPLISPRYCSTKREAEQGIEALSEGKLRPIFMRPGLMYHPHHRPWSTVPATLIDVSNRMHALHRRLRLPLPSPADMLRSRYTPQGLHPLAGALETPALHVDTVAIAICEAIARPDLRGVVATQSIRELAGWPAAPPPP